MIVQRSQINPSGGAQLDTVLSMYCISRRLNFINQQSKLLIQCLLVWKTAFQYGMIKLAVVVFFLTQIQDEVTPLVPRVQQLANILDIVSIACLYARRWDAHRYQVRLYIR